MKPMCKCGNDGPHDCKPCGKDPEETDYTDYNTMTPGDCRALCLKNQNTSGYKNYFGVEYKGECYCGYVRL